MFVTRLLKNVGQAVWEFGDGLAANFVIRLKIGGLLRMQVVDSLIVDPLVGPN